MNWSRGISSTEIIFILLFLLLYVYYIIKVTRIASNLNTSSSSVYFKFIVRSAYLALLIISLLGPNFGLSENEARSTGKEIFVAFDLSNSMNANDVEPSRLDKAKNEILKLLDQYKADKMGVIIFNSVAEVYTPLTFDTETIRSNINTLKTSFLPSGGTDYNSLFRLLIQKFDSTNHDISKICLVVSDGENFEALDQNLVKQLYQNNIRLFFVAVGTSLGGKIPEFNGFKKDKTGVEVITKLDLDQINKLAKVTRGQYYMLNNSQNEIFKMIETLKSLKNNSKNSNHVLVTYNKYVYFLILALALIAFDFLIVVKIIRL